MAGSITINGFKNRAFDLVIFINGLLHEHHILHRLGKLLTWLEESQSRFSRSLICHAMIQQEMNIALCAFEPFA